MTTVQIDWDKFRVGTLIQMPYDGLCIVEEMDVGESGDIHFAWDKPTEVRHQEVRISLTLVPATDGYPAWSLGLEHMVHGTPLMFEDRAYLLVSLQTWSRMSLDLVRAAWADTTLALETGRVIDGMG